MGRETAFIIHEKIKMWDKWGKFPKPFLFCLVSYLSYDKHNLELYYFLLQENKNSWIMLQLEKTVSSYLYW